MLLITPAILVYGRTILDYFTGGVSIQSSRRRALLTAIDDIFVDSLLTDTIL